MLVKTEQLLRAVFRRVHDLCAAAAPVVLLVDDLDSILRMRSRRPDADVSAALVPHFLALLDEAQDLRNVVVIGTTSREDLVDPAAIRAGRMDIKLRLDRPDQRAAGEILAMHLSSSSDLTEDLVEPAVEFLYEEHADTRLFEVRFASGEEVPIYFRSVASGAAIASIARRARSAALQRQVVDGSRFQLTTADLRTAARAELVTAQDFDLMRGPADWATIAGRGGQSIDHVRTTLYGRRVRCEGDGSRR
jgi:proteasome-associated ATPase